MIRVTAAHPGAFNASQANCDVGGPNYQDSAAWNAGLPSFDQDLDENSLVYCKNDHVMWIRDNEDLQLIFIFIFILFLCGSGMRTCNLFCV